MKRFIALAAVVLGLFSADAFAQKSMHWIGSDGWGIGTSYEQLFNNYNLTVITGTIFSIDTITPMNMMGPGVMLIVKDQSGQQLPVHLGPRWFIVHQDMNLMPGDQVEVHAARFSCNGKDSFAAFYVLTPDRALYLRDDDGFPYWCSWRKRKL